LPSEEGNGSLLKTAVAAGRGLKSVSLSLAEQTDEKKDKFYTGVTEKIPRFA